ncbi:MAG: hypothetical protein ACXVAE_07850 [Candidatus Limnocylindrales bacterium]
MKVIELKLIRVAFAVAVAALFATANGTFAGVYRSNTGAVAYYTVGGATWDGLAGFQMLTALTPHTGYSIAHPGQLDPSFTDDFLGFGTYKGAGTQGGFVNCPAYYGSGWDVYVDGVVYGAYSCIEIETIAGNAQSQSFIAQRHSGSCTNETGPGWDLLWQGAIVDCESLSFSYTDFVSAGAENVGNYPSQPLAISYVQMQYRPAGSHYFYWPSYVKATDPPYTITGFGTRTSFRIAP